MKKRRWTAAAVAVMLLFTGCSFGTLKEQKTGEIEYEGCSIIGGTPAAWQESKEAFEKLKEEIAEAEKSEMWISYADTGNEGRYLYIVRGYGRQETTGYSIEVNECYETEHTVVVRTTLLGPQKKEKTHKKKTYPYIVIKISYTDKQIIYE